MGQSLTYQGCITNDAKLQNFEGLDFRGLVDFARKAFEGAGRLYIGKPLSVIPSQIDLESEKVVWISREKATQPDPGPGIFVS